MNIVRLTYYWDTSYTFSCVCACAKLIKMSRNVGLTGWCNGGSPFLNGDLLALRAWIILTSIFFFIELYEEKDIDYPCTRNLQLAILVRIAVVSRPFT